MWGVTPYESVRSVQVIRRNWIEGMDDGVQSSFKAVLPICSDIDALPLWEATEINKCVDECGVIVGVPFPFDGCAVIPALPQVVGMGTVLVALVIRELGEAWE